MTAAGAKRPARMDDAAFRRLVDELKERTRVSSVVGRDIKLKRSGNEMKGLCPFHRERTPSFYANDVGGFAYCFGCGWYGDVFRYLMEAHNWSFREAYQRLASADLPVWTPAERAAARAEEIAERLADEDAARAFFADAADVTRGDPVDRYLRARGITMKPPPTVRFGMVPAFRHKETREWGRKRPAMLCVTQDRDGKLVGMQRVFLDGPKPDKAACKLNLGTVKTAAFRLGPPQHTITSTEGPEDGLSLAQELPDESVWVSFGTSQLPFMLFPPIVGRIIVAGQNDKTGALAVDAAGLALREQGYDVERRFPDPRYKDWNDWLRKREIRA